jgi:4-aminobutyrate aminotransferase / (S)-3-amino-2-methylpropionate transaminase / 5-aminovalerate transaminase
MGRKTNQELIALREQHIPQGPFNIHPIFVESAHGATITDVEGKQYLDFAGGIGVMNVGHGSEKVVAAIKDQADKYTHTCFHVVQYEPYVELAARLNQLAPGEFAKKSYFVNSGAEAVENAIKVARYATGRQGIITFDNAFHGRTYMAMTLTSKVKPYKFGFGPFCPEVYRARFAYCYRCPFGLDYPSCGVHCADYLEEFFVDNVAGEQVAALIAEPVQGEGGFIVPPPEYFPKLKAICEKYGIVFIMDEIQSGMGRTGKMFACEHWGLEPDIITSAKSLSAGMPLGAVIGRAELLDAVHVGGLGGTYGGNPLSCRAALAVLDELEDGLLQTAQRLTVKLEQRYQALADKYEIIGEVRGLGPMMAMELVTDRKSKQPATEQTKAIVANALDKGLLLLSCGNFGNVLRTLMPLVISDEELDRGFAILEECLAQA